jgi:hypothetical protein
MTNIRQFAGVGLALLVLCLVVIPVSAATLQPIPLQHSHLSLWLAAAALAFGTTVTINTVRAPNQPPPVNSYTATLVFLAGDTNPGLVALPAALQAKFVAASATDLTLKFTLCALVQGASAGSYAVHYNAGTGNLEVSRATGANTDCTLSVSVSLPTTNNAP